MPDKNEGNVLPGLPCKLKTGVTDRSPEGTIKSWQRLLQNDGYISNGYFILSLLNIQYLVLPLRHIDIF